MADFTDLLLSDEEKEIRRKRSDLVKRELERRSKDKILIHNPTTEDYILNYDGYKHPVPNRNKDIGYGKGNRVVERFLAQNYLRHMTNQLLQKRIDREVDKELARRMEQGHPAPTPYEKNQIINGVVGRIGRTNNPKNRAEVMKSLYLGVHEKFGRDAIPSDKAEAEKPTRTSEFDFMLGIDKGVTNIEEIVEDVPEEVTKEEAVKGMEA